MNPIVNCYDNYDEDSRLVQSKSKNIEYLTTIKYLDELIKSNSKILDLGAGTGRYSFYYAEKKHRVTALDIVPKHIKFINDKAEKHGINLKTKIGTGVDLSAFSDNYFDIVLCFGPFYHLINTHEREKCITECLRVLNRNGVLAIAYINKFFIIPYLAKSNSKFLREEFTDRIIEKGIIYDSDSIWTDAYVCSSDEIDFFMNRFDIQKLHNVGTDGISIMIEETINKMSDEEFKLWLKYHYKTCEEPSILGCSNHGLYIGKKN